jgi:tryptophan synthase alpha chain
VGFGISTPRQVEMVGRVADGVIVGSALVEAAGGEDAVRAASAFVEAMRSAADVTVRL